MKRERTTKATPEILLVGHGDDLVAFSALADDIRVTLVTEDALEGDIPRTAAVLVLVLSAYACESSKLRLVYDYVVRRVAVAAKYLLPVGELPLPARVFPEAAHLERTSMERLQTILKAL